MALAAVLTGCTGINAQHSIEALAKSERSWCFSGTGYGVNVVASGSGMPNGKVRCGPDGLTMESEVMQMGVPMRVVPQLQVGPPAFIPAPAPTIPPAPPVLPAPRALPQGFPLPGDLKLLPIAQSSRPPAPAIPLVLTDEDREVLRATADMNGLSR